MLMPKQYLYSRPESYYVTTVARYIKNVFTLMRRSSEHYIVGQSDVRAVVFIRFAQSLLVSGVFT